MRLRDRSPCNVMASRVEAAVTLKERENLLVEKTPHFTGFKPRPVEKLALKRIPKSTLSIECNHFLRNSTDHFAHGQAQLPYQLWLEAGKHPAPYPDKPDEQYNSNVWRNFRQAYGIVTSTKGMQMNDMIATLYPLNVPAPSKAIKERMLRKCEDNLNDFYRQRLLSDTRNPPLDKRGNILPPKSYRKYEPSAFALASSQENSPRQPPPPQSLQETRVDIFGKRVPKLGHTPYMWKMTYRINNPSYKHVQEDQQSKEEMAPQHPPIFTHIR